MLGQYAHVHSRGGNRFVLSSSSTLSIDRLRELQSHVCVGCDIEDDVMSRDGHVRLRRVQSQGAGSKDNVRRMPSEKGGA